MNERIIYKGKTVFIVALISIGLTFLTVYLFGMNFNRSIMSNLYISLSIISVVLFIFLTYGLYRGIHLLNNPPKIDKYEVGGILNAPKLPEFGVIDAGEGLAGILFSILLWIAMAILIVVLLVLLEALFWLSLFIIFSMLYWGFIRAIRLVLIKSRTTKGDFSASAFHSLRYTVLYTGWTFAIVYIVDILR